MPTICFFPWATITERLRFGDFHLVPLADALAPEIPTKYREAITALLPAYGYNTARVQEHIPVLREEGRDFTTELTEEQVAGAFEFATRLAFAVLAKRRFFDVRYVNTDHVRLVVQGFDPAGPGLVNVISRRRDGQVHNMWSRERFAVARPAHVSGECDFSRDVDAPLLKALEAADARGDALAERLADAIRLFVGANTDSSNVNDYTELIDLISAFGRLADSYDHAVVAQAFVRELPAPLDQEWEPRYGLRATDPKFVEARRRKPGKKASPGTPPFIAPIRQQWIEDATVLRHQYGHGHLRRPHTKFWTLREHLLLGAVALPLYVKALLQKAMLYTFTTRDEALNLAFDTLATIEPFASRAGDDESTNPWREAISYAEMYGFIRRAVDRIGVTEERDADGRLLHAEVRFPTELPNED